MRQLWYENTLIRNPVLSRKYIDESEWTRLPEKQCVSYPYSEFKHWRRYGLNPPEGLKNDKRYYSIIEFVDFMDAMKKPIVSYRVEYEYKEVNGEWLSEVWEKEYFVDLLSIAETI